MKGFVTLVGAGIGNAGLMTISALRALQSADCVVYDKLLGEGVMELIPESAEKINAGKQSANHTIPQDGINKILIEKALEGKNVVRLKGGDSYLFGRGGEETEELCRAGISFRVIPGITSAIAAPAFAGIPVTHRDCASSLHIFTGHGRDDRPPQIDFNACVSAGGTLVFLMGVKNLPLIVQGLINAGMDINTPAAVVQSGGTPFQKKAVSTLENICTAAEGLKSPSVIVVGAVCAYSDKLDWFSNLPLKGKSIVITRPKQRAAQLVYKLRELGASVTLYPCIKTEKISFDINEILEQLHNYNTVAFTSAEGVRAVFDSLYKSGFDARVFAKNKLAAVGGKTADELRSYGIIADFVPKEHSGRALAQGLAQNDSVLVLRAKNGSPELTQTLEQRGIAFKDMAVYETKPFENDIELPEHIDYAVFGSPSQVRCFERTEGYTAVCIGHTTAAQAQKAGLNCIIAENTDDEGIIEAILRKEGK